MIFTHLPAVARFIRRTHNSFAGLPVSETLAVLGSMNASMIGFPSMTGSTFEAMTGKEYGSLQTTIEINKVPSGGWEYIERVVPMVLSSEEGSSL